MRMLTAPVSIDDIMFPSAFAKRACEGFIAGDHSMICLHGPPGTGKSALARQRGQRCFTPRG